MEAIFVHLLNMSIAASWLVLAVVILRWVLKKAPKWMNCVLWVLVGIRLITPFSIESVFSLIPSVETVPQNLLYGNLAPMESGVPKVDAPTNVFGTGHFGEGVAVPPNMALTTTKMIAVIWLIGIAALLVYFIVSYFRLRRKVATAVLLRDNIWQSENVMSPFVLGLFKPRIYLPFGMSGASTFCVVAHEKAHIKRRDHWIKPLGFLLLAVYWFNPVIWLAYILLCRDIELACDERVIKKLTVDERADYSSALLSLSAVRRMIVACPLAFGEVDVKRRVRSVLNYRKPAFWVIILAVIACIVAAVCFLTNPKKASLDVLTTLQHRYMVSEIEYAAPQYNFAYTPHTAPQYCVTADSTLMVKNDILDTRDSAEWLELGSMKETELTKDNFDRYFDFNGEGGWEKLTAEQIRQNNKKAWRISGTKDSNATFYYLLFQKSGDVYLTYGYEDVQGEADPASANASIRWLFMLTVNDVAGETTVKQQTTPAVEDATLASDVGQTADGSIPQESADLDHAISVAILDPNKGTYTESDYSCESHVILGTRTQNGAPKAGESVGAAQITVYAMVLYQQYHYASGNITVTGGSHIPTALTFDVGKDGSYALVEYWQPMDGTYYEPDIRAKFPENICEDALDTQKYILVQMQSCYAQAVNFFKMDTNAVIADLFEKICSSPAEASAPKAYINAHALDYRELTYYGDNTLQYVFSEFLKGGQTGLKGQIMHIVMDDLIGGEAIDTPAATGTGVF